MRYSAELIRIIDGDTLVARIELGMNLQLTSPIRLVGINCAEMNTEAGKKAKAYLIARIEDLPITLEIDKKDWQDKYGRLLGILFLDEININQELIDRHQAVPYVVKK